jgi:flagellar basal body-associated protein FliL
MKIFGKVFRFLVVLIAIVEIVANAWKLGGPANLAGVIAVMVFWALAGGTALYFESKSGAKKATSEGGTKKPVLLIIGCIVASIILLLGIFVLIDILTEAEEDSQVDTLQNSQQVQIPLTTDSLLAEVNRQRELAGVASLTLNTTVTITLLPVKPAIPMRGS